MSDRSSNRTDHAPAFKRKLIGLIPAAGKASRIAPLPLSKEIYPVGFYQPAHHRRPRPKPVCLNLLEAMRAAGVTEAFIVLRHGKWDIPACLGDGRMVGMNLGYLMMDLPYGVPFTIDQAFPFVREATVVFGFPDIVFEPQNAFIELLARQAESDADVVVGLFPAENPQKMDMVAFDESGGIRSIHVKPARTDLKYTWLMAVWRGAFTRFLHDAVAIYDGRSPQAFDSTPDAGGEIHMGHIVQKALNAGMSVEKVIFEQGRYIDIGSPEDLMRACHVLGPDQKFGPIAGE